MSCLPTYNGKRYNSIELLQEEILSENKLKFSNYLKSLNFTSKQVSELLSDLEDKAISAIINDKIEYQIFNKSTSTNPDIKLTNPDRTMTSGGAKGSDTKWQYHANLNGIGTVTAYRPEHLDKLDKAELNEIENAYTNAANTLKRPVLDSNSEAGRLMRRNYLQVKNADMVVAVGEIVTPNEKDSKGFVNKSGKEIVAGGTGYAVQMAIATNKPVYVFDQFEEKWFKWENTSFVETTIPVLSKRFAGVGTRELSDAGAKAIEEVFKVNKELDNKAVDNKSTSTVNETTVNSESTNANLIEGVSRLFEDKPELANIGTREQYIRYLATVFPNRKIPNILYHGTNSVKFDKFSKQLLGTTTGSASAKRGFFATDNFDTATAYAFIKFDPYMRTPDDAIEDVQDTYKIDIQLDELAYEYQNDLKNSNELLESLSSMDTSSDDYKSSKEYYDNYLNPKTLYNNYTHSKKILNEELDLIKKNRIPEKTKFVHAIIVNSINPYRYDYERMGFRVEKYVQVIEEALNNNNDAVILENTYDTPTNYGMFKDNLINVYVVFEPEQIHILGSDEDIKGFKQFVNNDSNKTIKLGTTPSAYPLLNTYLLEGVLRFKTLFKDTFVYTESNKGFSEIIGTINSFYNIPKARHEDVYKATLNGINNFALRYGNSKTLLNMNDHTENRLLGTDSDIKRITKIGFDAYSKLSVANQLLYIKSKYKGLVNDSNILYYLKPVTDASRVMNNGFHKIDFKFDSKNPDLKAELNKSFMTLYNSDDVFLKQLAINLVRYNFITSGLSNRVGSFIDIIPYEILTNPVFNIQSGLQLVENEFIKYNVDPIENPTIELIKNYVIDNNLKFANNAGLTIELKDDETLILNSKQLYKLNKLIRNSKVVKAPDLNNVMRFYKVEQVVLLKNDKAMIAKGEDYKDYLVADPTLSDATTTEIGVKLTNLNVSETHKKLAQALFENEDTGDYKASDSKITIEQGKLKFNLALSSNSITNKC